MLNSRFFEDVDDLEGAGDAGVFRVVLHLLDLFGLCSPETVVGLDAGIRGCLGIAELIAERYGIVRSDASYGLEIVYGFKYANIVPKKPFFLIILGAHRLKDGCWQGVVEIPFVTIPKGINHSVLICYHNTGLRSKTRALAPSGFPAGAGPFGRVRRRHDSPDRRTCR